MAGQDYQIRTKHGYDFFEVSSSFQKAIRRWYDHRMSLADKLQKVSEHRAQYLRHLTYKVVFIYQHLQLGWGYDFE